MGRAKNSKKIYGRGIIENEKYIFQYGHEIELAIASGFRILIAFPDKDKVYESEELFSVFASRLPDPRRKEIKKILHKYSLQEYDAFELLKRSGAKLPIDKLEFVERPSNYRWSIFYV